MNALMGVSVTFRHVAGLVPYIHFPGNAREALTTYSQIFGCEVELHSFAEFHRTDGEGHWIAHGYLTDGDVQLFGSDVAGDEPPLRCEGLMLSLLGTSDPTVMREWFAQLARGGTVVDDLQERPWGAWDGRVVDRFGLEWLIGFEVGGDETSAS